MFFHRFQKRALCLWGRPVYLVDQHHLRKKWTTMKNELLLVAVEDRIAENVRRQQIAGELETLKRERQRARQCLGERGFADARDIFDQQVAACEQTSHGELYRLSLAYDHLADLPYEHVNVIRHARMICGDNAFRKHHVGGSEFRFCYVC
jgi:hypothetical protein